MMAIAAERSAIASYRVIPSLASMAASLACSAAVLERKTPAIVTQKPITVARTPNTLTRSAHLVAHSRSAFISYRYKSQEAAMRPGMAPGSAILITDAIHSNSKPKLLFEHDSRGQRRSESPRVQTIMSMVVKPLRD